MLINSKELIEMIEKEKSSFDDLRKCDFYDGIITGLNNVETYIKDKEYKEPVKLTTFQYEVLKRAYDNGFHWIAKDSDDFITKDFSVYKNEPERKEKCFIVKDLDEEYDCIPQWVEPFNDIVTWEGGAVEIKEILDNYEIVDSKEN